MSDRFSDVGSARFTFALDQAWDVAAALIKASGGRKIWLFEGEPGAGKTTLIKSITEALGGDPLLVNSPTFSIMNRYEVEDGSLNHFDLYRTKSEAELLDIGILEYLESGDWCFIEWPERLGGLRPENCFVISLEHESEGVRKIGFK